MKFRNRELLRVLAAHIPEHSTICYEPNSIGDLVTGLKPESSQVLGLQGSGLNKNPSHVLMFSLLENVHDVYEELTSLKVHLGPDTRIFTVSVSRLWSRFRRTGKQSSASWLPPSEVVNLFEQAGFEHIFHRRSVLLPFGIPVISRFINRWLSEFPLLKHFAVYNILVFRPRRTSRSQDPSVSVVVAARNEEGNIEELVRRLPRLAPVQELIFVEGGSRDNTWGKIQEIAHSDKRPDLSVRYFQQTGVGKGDAVRLGFEKATGDILIILDADLSVPPEELNRFIHLLRVGHCEFANGSRLVYEMEKQAMQFLNLLGNRFFGATFTFLLRQPIRDTLCGTKALWASDYRRIAAGRNYFGDFDPFGDFDLLFGASRLGLSIRDVPVHYKERVYGSTNISRFRHGVLLFKMTWVAVRRLRFP